MAGLLCLSGKRGLFNSVVRFFCLAFLLVAVQAQGIKFTVGKLENLTHQPASIQKLYNQGFIVVYGHQVFYSLIAGMAVVPWHIERALNMHAAAINYAVKQKTFRVFAETSDGVEPVTGSGYSIPSQAIDFLINKLVFSRKSGIPKDRDSRLERLLFESSGFVIYDNTIYTTKKDKTQVLNKNWLTKIRAALARAIQQHHNLGPFGIIAWQSVVEEGEMVFVPVSLPQIHPQTQPAAASIPLPMEQQPVTGAAQAAVTMANIPDHFTPLALANNVLPAPQSAQPPRLVVDSQCGGDVSAQPPLRSEVKGESERAKSKTKNNKKNKVMRHDDQQAQEAQKTTTSSSNKNEHDGKRTIREQNDSNKPKKAVTGHKAGTANTNQGNRQHPGLTLKTAHVETAGDKKYLLRHAVQVLTAILAPVTGIFTSWRMYRYFFPWIDPNQHGGTEGASQPIGQSEKNTSNLSEISRQAFSSIPSGRETEELSATTDPVAASSATAIPEITPVASPVKKKPKKPVSDKIRLKRMFTKNKDILHPLIDVIYKTKPHMLYPAVRKKDNWLDVADLQQISDQYLLSVQKKSERTLSYFPVHKWQSFEKTSVDDQYQFLDRIQATLIDLVVEAKLEASEVYQWLMILCGSSGHDLMPSCLSRASTMLTAGWDQTMTGQLAMASYSSLGEYSDHINWLLMPVWKLVSRDALAEQPELVPVLHTGKQIKLIIPRLITDFDRVVRTLPSKIPDRNSIELLSTSQIWRSSGDSDFLPQGFQQFSEHDGDELAYSQIAIRQKTTDSDYEYRVIVDQQVVTPASGLESLLYPEYQALVVSESLKSKEPLSPNKVNKMLARAKFRLGAAAPFESGNKKSSSEGGNRFKLDKSQPSLFLTIPSGENAAIQPLPSIHCAELSEEAGKKCVELMKLGGPSNVATAFYFIAMKQEPELMLPEFLLLDGEAGKQNLVSEVRAAMKRSDQWQRERDDSLSFVATRQVSLLSLSARRLAELFEAIYGGFQLSYGDPNGGIEKITRLILDSLKLCGLMPSSYFSKECVSAVIRLGRIEPDPRKRTSVVDYLFNGIPDFYQGISGLYARFLPVLTFVGNGVGMGPDMHITSIGQLINNGLPGSLLLPGPDTANTELPFAYKDGIDQRCEYLDVAGRWQKTHIAGYGYGFGSEIPAGPATGSYHCYNVAAGTADTYSFYKGKIMPSIRRVKHLPVPDAVEEELTDSGHLLLLLNSGTRIDGSTTDSAASVELLFHSNMEQKTPADLVEQFMPSLCRDVSPLNLPEVISDMLTDDLYIPEFAFVDSTTDPFKLISEIDRFYRLGLEHDRTPSQTLFLAKQQIRFGNMSMAQKSIMIASLVRGVCEYSSLTGKAIGWELQYVMFNALQVCGFNVSYQMGSECVVGVMRTGGGFGEKQPFQYVTKGIPVWYSNVTDDYVRELPLLIFKDDSQGLQMLVASLGQLVEDGVPGAFLLPNAEESPLTELLHPLADADVQCIYLDRLGTSHALSGQSPIAPGTATYTCYQHNINRQMHVLHYFKGKLLDYLPDSAIPEEQERGAE